MKPTAHQIAVREESARMRKTSDRLLDKQGILPVKEVFDAGVAGVQTQLRRAYRGRLAGEVSPQIRREITQFLVAQIRSLSNEISAIMLRSIHTTIDESLGAVSRFLFRMFGKPTPVDDPVVAARITRACRGKIAFLRKEAARALSESLVDGLNSALQIRGRTGDTIGSFLEAIETEFEASWWLVARTIRTETSRAFNMVQGAVLEEVSREIKGLMARWTELVDDVTELPMDADVGDDSRILHGQVSNPLALKFTCLTRYKEVEAPPSLANKSWPHPPNRPNDRAVLTPWHKDWKIPAYIVQAGQRIPM